LNLTLDFSGIKSASMREIINRSAIYIIPRQPFKKWASRYNEESQEELESRLNEKHLYLIDYVNGQDLTPGILESYYDKIFEYELMSWNSYESEWPENRNLDLFFEWFEVKLCNDIFDLENERIITE